MSVGPMNDEAVREVREMFLSLLPKTISQELVDTFMTAADNYPNSFAAAVYECATYAGWCRGYAEGDGAHRPRGGTRIPMDCTCRCYVGDNSACPIHGD